MKKYFFPIIIQLMCLAAVCQTQKPLLVKASTGNPTDYMRKVGIINKQLVFSKANENETYSFEKKKPLLGKNENYRPAVNGGGLSVMVKPEISIQEKPSVAAAATIRINNIISKGGLSDPDPMPAIGEKTILISNAHWLKFFDKSTGQMLAETTTTALFWRFLSPVIPGENTPNPEYASNFYDIPKDIPYPCSKSKPCNVTDCGDGGYGKDNLPCPEKTDEGLINEAYDVRVLYQKEHKRFVVVAALRNQSSQDNNCYNANGAIDCSQYLIRLIAIAVSVSENPADGFHIYRTGENNYRDWPRAIVDQDYLVIANNSPGSDGSSVVTCFSFSQMKDGQGPTIDGFRIKRNDGTNTPKAVVPVTNLLTNQYSTTLFFLEQAEGGSGTVKIWYLKKPPIASTIFENPPTTLKLAGEITVNNASFAGGAYAGITYFDNSIYTVSYQSFYNVSSSKRQGYGLNIFKIPVFEKSNGQYEASDKPGDGFQHFIFKNENYSYMDPSLAVDAFKNIAIQFIRIPRSKTASEKPQIRYKVKFSQEAEWRASKLVKEWEVADEGEKKLVDYSWIVKDPYSISHFWQAHKYKSVGGGATWLNKIDLSSF